MAIINHAKREINAKIVYYGHEGAGKGTSLRYLYERIKPSLRGELKSQPASGGSLLFYDFSPFEQPVLSGYHVRFHIYTLPGRVTNPAAWKMTLKGADGLVLVMDAAPDALPSTHRSIAQLRDYLASYGRGLADVPAVLQVNKTDRAGTINTAAIAASLELGDVPVSLSAARSGEGVLETFSHLSRQVMAQLGRDIARQPEHEAGSSETDGGQTLATLSEAEASDRPSKNATVPFNVPHTATGVVSSEGEGMLQVAFSDESVSLADGRLRIPLTVSLNGQTGSFVVSVTVEPDRGAP
jgi:signal recognition particle receptor subunit beta